MTRMPIPAVDDLDWLIDQIPVTTTAAPSKRLSRIPRGSLLTRRMTSTSR
jgi:hypothetical protein